MRGAGAGARGRVGGILLAILLAACSTGKSDAAAAGTPAGAAGSTQKVTARSEPGRDAGRILFLGTSLTAGLGLDPDSAYPQRIQRKIDSVSLGYSVVNAGVSGETAAGLLRRLNWVLRQPAKVIVVETGANDGLRGQSVAATKATIAKVLDRIHAEQPKATVVLMQMEAPRNLGASYTAAFHAMYPALAREKGVVLLPFLLDGVAGRPGLNQADGVHPNDAGEPIVAENVWRGLEAELRKYP